MLDSILQDALAVKRNIASCSVGVVVTVLDFNGVCENLSLGENTRAPTYNTLEKNNASGVLQ